MVRAEACASVKKIGLRGARGGRKDVARDVASGVVLSTATGNCILIVRCQLLVHAERLLLTPFNNSTYKQIALQRVMAPIMMLILLPQT